MAHPRDRDGTRLLNLLMIWALGKPQYGAFAAPIVVLFILQLL